MKRVASLYLPEWPIDRLRRAGRIPSPSLEGGRTDLDGIGAAAAAERARTCSVPRGPAGRPGALWAREREEGAARSRRHQENNDGWRPGAKWAKRELEAEVARLPGHQRPSMREMGRRSEAADHPFKAHPFKTMPPDECGPPALARWRDVPAVAYPGEGPRADKAAPFPGEGRFFLTGRMTGDVVARACRDEAPKRRPWPGADDLPPLVTSELVGGGALIAAASPAARALGLAPGMPVTSARAMVKGLLILPADREGDAADLRRLAVALARRWAPTVTVSGDDGLLIDLTGVAHLHGGEAAFARRLTRLLNRMGCAARVALADTAGAAWALARHGGERSFICPPGAQREALAPLPASALRLEEAHVELLRRLGVDTVGELAKLPRRPLARRFGGALVRRLDQAHGHMPEPLEPIAVPERITVVQRFAEPIATAKAITHWLGALVPKLCEALAKAGLGARSTLLVAERVDHRDQHMRIGLARPSRDPGHLARLMLRRVEEIEPGLGIDSLALHVVRAEPLGPELLGPELAGEQAPDLAPLVDLLANRISRARLWRVRPVESDVPERSQAFHPPIDETERATPALRDDDVRRLCAVEDNHSWHPRWPRPVRLLPRPERVEHVLAELPDHPPKRFTWRGDSYRVMRADGPERITGEWWRRPTERDAVRDYFHLEDEAGHRFWLFRRGDGVQTETGDLSWYLHGMFG